MTHYIGFCRKCASAVTFDPIIGELCRCIKPLPAIRHVEPDRSQETARVVREALEACAVEIDPGFDRNRVRNLDHPESIERRNALRLSGLAKEASDEILLKLRRLLKE